MSAAPMASLFERATELHRLGNTAPAEALYRQVTGVHAPEAWRRLGVLCLQRQASAEALAWFGQLVQAMPEDALAWCQHALALRGAGRAAQAWESCARALALRPGLGDAWYLRAQLAQSAQRFPEALDSYDALLRLQPEHPQAQCQRGATLLALGRAQEAAGALQAVLARDPAQAGALCNLGVALLALGQPEHALASLERALELAPADAEAWCNRGIILHTLERHAQALDSLAQCLRLAPGHAHGHYNRANVLHSMGRLEQARDAYRQALQLRPDHADTHYNLGVLQQKMNGHHAALDSFARAMQLMPGSVAARFNGALSRLALGQLEAGFAGYELRWQCPPLQQAQRRFPMRLWLGQESLSGKRILLHAEQGLGDTIQFVRYAALAAAQGARVVLDVPAPLRALCQGVAGVAALTAPGAPPPPCDFHAPLMSLPLAFKTGLATIPGPGAYLHSDEGARVRWAARLGARRALRVGLAWSGNPDLNNDRNRSIALAQLLPLCDERIEWFSLQKEVRPDDAQALAACPAIVPCGADLTDFADTAALVDCLDLVIAVDTSVAHLAGALGKPVWVLLPFAPDWRWMLERADSPWYGSARLFRQCAPGDWTGVLGALGAALDALVASDRLAARLQAALAQHQRGQFAAAETIYRELLQAQSAHPEVLHLLGVLAYQNGRHAEAAGLIGRALELVRSPVLYCNRGLALHALGRFDEAIEGYRAALALAPAHLEAHLNLGNALQASGQYAGALECYEAALRVKPDYAAALNALGTVEQRLGHAERALAAFRKALAADAALPQAHANLGDALFARGEPDEAIACYRRALALQPAQPELWCSLGRALRSHGQFDACIAAFEAALQADPRCFAAHLYLGKALNTAGRSGAAAGHCRAALALDAQHAEAHLNMGNVLQGQGQLEQALACYREALRIDPGFVEAFSNLGSTYQLQGRMAQAIACYRDALARRPESAEIRSNLLFALSYEGDGERYLAEARRFGAAVAAQARPFQCWPAALARVPGAPLRVGLVSGDLFAHPVGFFLEALLGQIDGARIELFAYSNNAQEDALTRRIKPRFRAWSCWQGRSDEACAQQVLADGVQILIDLSGHTARNRLPVFGWKAAPVQASWLGYWASTGVGAIDYLLTDPLAVPAAEAHWLTETPWYLADTRLCLTPPQVALAPGALPALADGCLHLACFQNMFKINDAVLALWSRVLQALPDARLRIQNRQLGIVGERSALAQRLAHAGIDAHRVTLAGPMARDAYLAAYQEVDFVLDTFPYTGGTTTCEAMWMGVPTLSLALPGMLGRQGESLLCAAGLSDWVARDPDQYVDLARRHGSDLARLARLRAALRGQALGSALFDAPRFARALEQALASMWQQAGATRRP